MVDIKDSTRQSMDYVIAWTRQAELQFKRYFRSFPNMPREVARLCCEVHARYGENRTERAQDAVHAADVFPGLRAYERLARDGTQSFYGIEIETKAPYRVFVLPADAPVVFDETDIAMRRASEWKD